MRVPVKVLIEATKTETWECQKCCNNRGKIQVYVLGSRRYTNGFGETSAAKLTAAGFKRIHTFTTAASNG